MKRQQMKRVLSIILFASSIFEGRWSARNADQQPSMIEKQ
jgi:hypothetical protein